MLKPRRATRNQVVGVAAQVAFAAPALVASLAVARWTDLVLVADLALAFGATSTILSAASFNLTQHLALWGLRGFSHEVFWLNRVIACCAGTAIAVALLAKLGVDPHLVVLAAMVKLADSVADLGFGLSLLRSEPEVAMGGLLRWSVIRLGVFAGGTAVGRWVGLGGVEALLVGGSLQLALMLPWRTAKRVMITRDRVGAAIRLGRSAAHLSVASTACGVLVTVPRFIAPSVIGRPELGYLGVVFLASTLIGMSFNVAWLRLATASRTSDPVVAVRNFLREGVALGAILIAGMWVTIPLVERVYDIEGAGFGSVMMTFGSAFVLLYFVMGLANMLKTSNIRLLEATAYLCAALVLAVSTILLNSLLIGLVAAATVLAAFVVGGVKSVRNLAAF